MKTNTTVKQKSVEYVIDAGLRMKIVVKIGIFTLILAAILLGLAGRLNWLTAWLYLVGYAIVLIIGGFVIPLEQDLLDERTQIKENVKSWDKPLAIVLSILTPFGLLIVAGLDTRFGGSPDFPLWLEVGAVIIAMLGYLISIWAAASNKFFARFVRIQKERGHTVITSGPYQYVRHPGYLGTGIFDIATALALGSLWALLLAVVLVLLTVIRTALEDKTLHEELDGYRAYAARTRYRLIPGIW